MKADGKAIFSALEGLSADFVTEACLPDEATTPVIGRKPRREGNHFWSSGWGVAIICAMVSLGVLAVIIRMGWNAPDVPPVVGTAATEPETVELTEPIQTEAPTESPTEAPTEPVTEFIPDVPSDDELLYGDTHQENKCAVAGVIALSADGILNIPSHDPQGREVVEINLTNSRIQAKDQVLLDQIKKMTVPNTVTAILGSTVAALGQNCTIELSPDHPCLYFENGFLLRRMGETGLVAYYVPIKDQRVTVPEGVTSIASQAIMYYVDQPVDESIYISLPSTVGTTYAYAFEGLGDARRNIKTMVVRVGNQQIKAENGCLLDKNGKYYGGGTLYYAMQGFKVDQFHSFSYIERGALANMGLTEFHISHAINSIEPSALARNPDLVITVDEDHEFFYMDGDCLMGKDAYEDWSDGYCYPEVTEFDIIIHSRGGISEKATTIGEKVYSGRKDLTTLALHEGMAWLQSYAFADCTSMTNVSLPASTWLLENGIFDGCTALTEIRYQGTVAEWQKVSKWNHWLGEGTQVTEVICTDGTVPIA